jgi:hypothetical protein
MLDRIGHIGRVAFDPGLGERAIEQTTSRTDKRFAGEIFLIPWLLADQHDASGFLPLAENRLRGVAPQRTVAAMASIFAQSCKARPFGSRHIR